MKKSFLMQKALNYLGKHLPEAVVVQVGAMDGVSFDETKEFLDAYNWKSILIEPIPHLFNKLKENLAYRKNTHFENFAICSKNGNAVMLTIPEVNKNQPGVSEWHLGMSSFYPIKNEFKDEDFHIQEKFGTKIKVSTTTILSLIKKYDLKNIDIFICDAEGYDWEIFNQLDLIHLRPKFVRLEFEHLHENEKKLLLKKLEINNYHYEISGKHSLNLDAIDKKYFSSEGFYEY
jgi:FkbM family methyltransferase